MTGTDVSRDMTVPTYVVNVEGAVVRDDEYLLIERAAAKEHASGSLSFPGGKVEQSPGGDATIEATARCELAEEVGIEVGTSNTSTAGRSKAILACRVSTSSLAVSI